MKSSVPHRDPIATIVASRHDGSFKLPPIRTIVTFQTHNFLFPSVPVALSSPNHED
jgi:hypothetical protein